MTSTQAPTVAQLAAAWAATATPDELAQVELMCRSYVRTHGSGMLTTEECRAVYRMYVQRGQYAFAVAVASAVQAAPYGSRSAWDSKRAGMAAKNETKRAERKLRAAATPGRATAHAACDHPATPAGRKACRTARKATATAA